MVVYLALGGNIGNTKIIFKKVRQRLLCLPCSKKFCFSRIFRSKAVSPIPQREYLNAVCSFVTDLQIPVLWNYLQTIEKELGKVPKSKDAPRIIDLDLLFFENFVQKENLGDLILPHPKWKERVFVLKPLLDLKSRIFLSKEGEKEVIELEPLIQSFSKEELEAVYPIGKIS